MFLLYYSKKDLFYMTTETEIWRTPIYKGEIYDNYQVSNLGRLINLNYRRTGKAKLMEPYEKGRKYLQVSLYKNGKEDWIYVHQLIAETFLPNPENKPCINHKIEGDEGKKINMVFFNEDGSINKEKSTIEWATYEENNNYGTRNQRIFEKTTNGKLSKPVLQLSLDGELIREYPSIKEAERNGFNHCNICQCCNGKQKTHKGFRWEYK